eukprot:5641833-Amphidinium_carterae.1
MRLKAVSVWRALDALSFMCVASSIQAMEITTHDVIGLMKIGIGAASRIATSQTCMCEPLLVAAHVLFLLCEGQRSLVPWLHWHCRVHGARTSPRGRPRVHRKERYVVAWHRTLCYVLYLDSSQNKIEVGLSGRL